MEREYRTTITRINKISEEGAYHIAVDKLYKSFICDIANERFADMEEIRKIACIIKRGTFSKRELKMFIKD